MKKTIGLLGLLVLTGLVAATAGSARALALRLPPPAARPLR